MTYRWHVVVAAIVMRTAVVLAPEIGSADDVVLGDPYAERFQRDRIKFDSVHQVLIAFRPSYDSAQAAVVWADADGARSGRVTPLADFPHADAFDVWAVAAGPQSIVVSGVLQAGEKTLLRPPRHLILTYDLAGALRQQWLVNPYHHHEIAVDQRGNVYALGHRITKKRSANLVLKYSSEGVLEREFFPADLCPKGGDSVIADSRSGSNQFWIEGERLLVYVARLQELFQFDLDGTLQRRTALGKALAQLAKDHGGTRAEIMTLVGDGRSASMLAQVRIWGERISSALARLSLDGARPQSLELAEGGELGTFQVPLLGRSGDSMLFLNRYSAKILRR